MKTSCEECGRVFDFTDQDDANEWYYGHDCETVEEEEHSHIFGPFERSRLAGTLHRRCTVDGCDFVSLDGDENDDEQETEITITGTITRNGVATEFQVSTDLGGSPNWSQWGGSKEQLGANVDLLATITTLVIDDAMGEQ